MQFIDLKRQYELIKTSVDSGIAAVLEHGKYIMGPEIAALEKKLADFAGTKHCIVCSSGTDALLMPLMAWGIGPGDAVFTTPFTFFATAEVISLVGATPVFVDIDERTYNIDFAKLEEAIIATKNEGKLNPAAIIPVNLFGLCADWNSLDDIAHKYDLRLLEDAAQSFGASLNGRRSGSFGDCGATSFFPAKPLGCYGDGGAVFTNDDALYEKLVSIRIHGQGTDKYENVRIGINGRLDSIQAAVLLAKMTIFEEEITKRNRVAAKYSELLRDKVVVPFIPEKYISAWAQYSVLEKSAEARNATIAKLSASGIPTAIYYPKPLHLQTAFKELGYKKGDFPISENIGGRIFSLPMHPYLTDDEIELICSAI
ncbi:MAG: DegT/DnrJ/EryC1/StrS aminotransferase [Ignavibacteria bacterium]|nr:DegT/DnrJ/EryC1/StrS aminotransferase [Ignavibacteria bacterium]